MSEMVIRAMSAADLDRAVDWAAAEGWNPGIDDAAAFRTADPDGFLMGFIGAEPVASISAVRTGATFGFIGFYICRPELRGRGRGFALWHAGMARLEGRTVGLDGVVAQQAAYARSGFVLAHRNVRYGGSARAGEIADPRIVAVGARHPIGLAGSVAAYDTAFFPAPRTAFIRAWIAPPGRRTVAFVEDNAIRGYGCIRACREGSKIGPLFADNDAIAARLFAALTSRHVGEPVFLDVPEPNAAAIALAERNGLTPVFETARMYKGPAPALPLDRTYGITTFELG